MKRAPQKKQFGARDRELHDSYAQKLKVLRQKWLAEEHDRDQAQRRQNAITWEMGQCLKEVHDLGLYRIDSENINQWADRVCGLGRRQAGKYIKIFEVLPAGLVQDLPLGVEALYQIALSCEELREALIALALDEGLPAEALDAGRQAGTEALEKDAGLTTAEAIQITQQAARTFAGRPTDTPEPRRQRRGTYDRSQKARAERGTRQLISHGKQRDAMMAGVDQGEPATPELAMMLEREVLMGREAERHLWRVAPERARLLGIPCEDGAAVHCQDDAAVHCQDDADPPRRPRPDRRQVDRDPGQAPGTPQADPPKEKWEAPVARAVFAHLAEDERREIAVLMVMALSGRPPRDLVALVRRAGTRMGDDVPRDVREDLDTWLRHAAHPEYEHRWPYLYNLFIFSGIPEFTDCLHLLKGVRYPPAIRSILETAWAYWPHPDDFRLPEGAGEDDALAYEFAHRTQVAIRLALRFIAAGQPANTAAMSYLWEQFMDLRDEIRKLGPLLPPEEEAAAPPPGAAAP